MSHNIKPGVATGDQVQEIFRLAKSKNFALPAVNVIGSSSVNAVLETAKELNAPVIIQFSNGGAVFSVGSITFCGSLPHNNCKNNISTIIDNVVRKFLRN